MQLKDRIVEDMKAAMRARDARRLSAIRLILAAIKQREVDERTQLDDQAVVAVIDKMLKQRRDSIAQFQVAGRADLVAVEEFEAGVLKGYMPQALTATEVEAAIAQAVEEAGANGVQDMGKVMALLKPRLAGRTDMAEASRMARAALGKL